QAGGPVELRVTVQSNAMMARELRLTRGGERPLELLRRPLDLLGDSPVTLSISDAPGDEEAVVYRAELLAADAINRAAEFMAAKRMLIQGRAVDKKRLADDSMPIKQILEKPP
ncbi:MAG: oxidoreductase C-terminal domain-containing protein, partial [Xanthomonadales bacterium]|nr:oxidoreductase C-terminal domain-containing protein [Xanthomonadales bacterium]